MRFEQLKESYFGKEYEWDLVGKLDVEDPKYLVELARLQEMAKKRGYKIQQKNALPFKEAIELTKKFQPWDPTNPRKDFARDLRLALAEKLGLETPEDLNNLEIYTCIGGPLDAHGRDFFLSYTPKSDIKWPLLFYDISKNPEKEFSPKADVLIGGDIPDRSDQNFDEKEYLKIIDDYAAESLDVWQEKQSQAQERLQKAA